MKKATTLLLILVMILSLFTGCASEPAADAEKVIKIGVFEPQTGENGGGGFQEVLGIRPADGDESPC